MDRTNTSHRSNPTRSLLIHGAGIAACLIGSICCFVFALSLPV